jgi:hypothetical protein
MVWQVVTYPAETRPDRTETKETNETQGRNILRMVSKLQAKQKKRLPNEEVKLRPIRMRGVHELHESLQSSHI